MTSSMLESQPVFEARLRSIGLVNNLITRLLDNGITSMGSLAFICPATPGQGDDAALFTVLEPLMGYTADDAMPAAVKSMMRRLWFEANAIALADVRNRVERTEDTQPRKLPLPERESRRARQQAALTGIVIEGHLEPSHSLIDLCYSMREEEILRYIEPATCLCRQQELLGCKKEAFIRLDGNGKLVTVHKDAHLEADLSSEYRVRLALQRRSLALDQIGLLVYGDSELYHDYLYSLMLKDVPDSHMPISMKQILEAEKQIWLHMASVCRAGVSIRPDGTLPMKTALESALRDPIVLSQLTPLPKSFRQASTLPPPPRNQNTEDQRSRSRYRNQYDHQGGKGKKGGKGGKSKGKGTKGAPPLPEGLQGSSRTDANQPICFNYNLAGCPGATPGRRCVKGMHVCCRCFSNSHTYANCDRK